MLEDTADRVWLVLVALTFPGYWIGVDHGLGDGRAALVPVFVLAFLKAWLVGRHFMELSIAPRGLRAALDAWVVVTAGGVIGIYLAG